jgi:hypothetical protein
MEIRSDRGAEHVRLLDLHQALEALERENAAVAKARTHRFRCRRSTVQRVRRDRMDPLAGSFV